MEEYKKISIKHYEELIKNEKLDKLIKKFWNHEISILEKRIHCGRKCPFRSRKKRK